MPDFILAVYVFQLSVQVPDLLLVLASGVTLA